MVLNLFLASVCSENNNDYKETPSEIFMKSNTKNIWKAAWILSKIDFAQRQVKNIVFNQYKI